MATSNRPLIFRRYWRKFLNRYIDGIVLQVKHKTFASLHAWPATFFLHAIEYYFVSFRDHNLGLESELNPLVTELFLPIFDLL